MVHGSDLPAPQPQFNVVVDGLWLARVDFAWPEWRVALECDGYTFHSDRLTFERDRRRWNALTQAGWRVVIVTWRDITDSPEYVIELLRQALSVAA